MTEVKTIVQQNVERKHQPPPHIKNVYTVNGKQLDLSEVLGMPTTLSSAPKIKVIASSRRAPAARPPDEPTPISARASIRQPAVAQAQENVAAVPAPQPRDSIRIPPLTSNQPVMTLPVISRRMEQPVPSAAFAPAAGPPAPASAIPRSVRPPASQSAPPPYSMPSQPAVPLITPIPLPQYRSVRLGTGTRYSTIREYKLAFTALKNTYPVVVSECPVLEDADNLQLVDKVYDAIYRRCRRIGIIRAIKMGVIAICLFIEVIATKVCGINNAKTFLEFQIKNLETYDGYIEEFCERWGLDKEAISDSTPWPLEIRFTLTLLTQFVMFLATKTLANNSNDLLAVMTQMFKNRALSAGAPSSQVAESSASGIMGMISNMFGGLSGMLSTVFNLMPTGPQVPRAEPQVTTPLYNE